MFSGKSEELIRRVRRAVIARKRVQVFKSHLDARYGGIYSISSHDGRTVEAIPADSAAQIGQMTTAGRHVVHPDGRREQVTQLDRDEIYRLVENLDTPSPPGPGSGRG